jgi:nicotinamide mononucleotide transporter
MFKDAAHDSQRFIFIPVLPGSIRTFAAQMNLSEWGHLFGKQLREAPALEWIGTGFGICEVILARFNNILLYPAGIVSVLVSSYIFLDAGLYAEFLLNLYYLVMSIYGWYAWVHKPGVRDLKIGRSSNKDWGVTAVITGIGFALLYLALRYMTDSTVPAWDAWVSATAWAGMWLLARRRIENWILLNISNAFAIPLLIRKELPLYALLTFVLFIVAISGYFAWQRELKNQVTHDRPAIDLDHP